MRNYPKRQLAFANPATKTHADELPCTRCGKPGPKYPRYRYCKACTVVQARVDLLRREYGMTPDDVLKLLEAQGSMCALCETVLTPALAHIDHDHQTKRVRGILCRQCNTSLGQFGDSVEGLMRAVRYVQTALPS